MDFDIYEQLAELIPYGRGILNYMFNTQVVPMLEMIGQQNSTIIDMMGDDVMQGNNIQ